MPLGAPLEAAVRDFLTRSSRASNRMDAIADYCIGRLQARGLTDVRGGSTGEAQIRGFGRPKNWDVAAFAADNPRILVSLKSIKKNLAGTVPNRIDDLMGEIASVQIVRPELTVGYLAILDLNGTTNAGGLPNRTRNGDLIQTFCNNVSGLTVRGSPNWNPGTLEASWVFIIDTDPTRPLMPNASAEANRGEAFFDTLVAIAREREPALI